MKRIRPCPLAPALSTQNYLYLPSKHSFKDHDMASKFNVIGGRRFMIGGSKALIVMFPPDANKGRFCIKTNKSPKELR